MPIAVNNQRLPPNCLLHSYSRFAYITAIFCLFSSLQKPRKNKISSKKPRSLLFSNSTMAKFLPYLLLFLTIFPIVFSSPLSIPTIQTDQQLHNIIEALAGSGDFQNWAGILSVSDPTTFPITATIFIPNDASVSSMNLIPSFNSSDILYHILPQQLTFENLLTQSIGSRLPTLLPGKSILVTNNSRLNFTIDDTLVIRPNLYMNGVVVVHGIGSALNYSFYGDEPLDLVTNPYPYPNPIPVSVPAASPSSSSLPFPENHMNESTSGGNQTSGGSSHSDAISLSIEFPAALATVLFVVLVFGCNLADYEICILLYLMWSLVLLHFLWLW